MKKMLIVLAAVLLWSVSGGLTCAADEGAWPGVDEAVVEKYAEAGGRPASEPIINIEGDVLLFAFLIGGVVGGFVMGYYYREFTAAGKAERNGKRKKEGKKAYAG